MGSIVTTSVNIPRYT